jgi:hypothetical protein
MRQPHYILPCLQKPPWREASWNEGILSTLTLLSLAQLMIVLDFSIVNVALPSIQSQFFLAPAKLQWVVSAYAIISGSLLLLELVIPSTVLALYLVQRDAARQRAQEHQRSSKAPHG